MLWELHFSLLNTRPVTLYRVQVHCTAYMSTAIAEVTLPVFRVCNVTALHLSTVKGAVTRYLARKPLSLNFCD